MPVYCQFDQFRQTLSEKLHTELIMYSADGSTVHSLTAPEYELFEADRGEVTFTLISSPDQLVTFSLQDEITTHSGAFLFFPLVTGDFFYNSIKLNEQQVGLITLASGAPFSICAGAQCQWVVASFVTQSRHLNLMSSSTMPVTLEGDHLMLLRSAINRFLSGERIEGTPVLDQVHFLLNELAQTPPPLRPQKNTGRSRLSRKHIIPTVIRAIRNQRSSAPFVNQVAAELNVTSHSIINMFKEVMGVSPKKYWLYRKLYLFRDALLSDEYNSVSDAAYALDMSDLGRMSARYCKLFGELPSETLKR